MSDYAIGTVIGNTEDHEFNPYVLTIDGWVEVGSDSTYPTRESDVLTWLNGHIGWAVIYRGKQERSDIRPRRNE